MYSSHCVHTKAIKTTKKIVSPPCTQGDCQSNSFTCSKLWFHIAKDPQMTPTTFLSVWCGQSKELLKANYIVKRTFMKSSDSVHVWATLRNITLDLIMHCTYHFACGLSFRFQVSLSIAAMALSYSCHNMNLFWLKAVGLQFIPRKTTTTFNFSFGLADPYETNHVSHPPHLKTMGWCYWGTQLLILPNVFLICIYNFIVTWDWLACFMSIDNLNYVTLSRFLSKVALLLKMLIRKLFA
jgi:hypothetical protein